MEGRGPELVIEGKIVNSADEVRRVPLLRAAVDDKDEREIFTWTFPTEKTELPPGENVRFTTRLIGPPPVSRA